MNKKFKFIYTQHLLKCLLKIKNSSKLKLKYDLVPMFNERFPDVSIKYKTLMRWYYKNSNIKKLRQKKNQVNYYTISMKISLLVNTIQDSIIFESSLFINLTYWFSYFNHWFSNRDQTYDGTRK